MTTPDAHASSFDPTTGRPLPGTPESGTLLVVHTEGAREDGWAGQAMLALARGWRTAGRRIFLCDVSMESPLLHLAAEIDNAEGMSDALRYGSSFKRVAHRIEPNLFLATAGSAAVDAGALRRDPRWETFTGGFSEAGALLVLCGPIDGESMGELAERASTVVVLSAVDEIVPAAEIGERIDVHLVRGAVDDGAYPTLGASVGDGEVARSMDWEEPAPDEVDPEPSEDTLDIGALAPELETEADEADEAEPMPLADLAPDEPTVSEIAPEAPIDGEAPAGVMDDEPVSWAEPTVVEEDADAADDFGVVEDFGLEVEGEDEFELAPEEAPAQTDEPEPVIDKAEMVTDDPPVDTDGPITMAVEDEAADDEDGEDQKKAGSVSDYDRVVVAPKRESSRGDGGSSLTRVLLAALLLVVLGVLGANWFGVIEIPGLPVAPDSEGQGQLEAAEPGVDSPGASNADEVGETVSGPAPAASPAAGATPDAGVAAFVIALASFADREDAEAQRVAWMERTDGVAVHFILAPVEVDGRLWFRLLAGPAPDQAAADGMRRTLAGLAGTDGSNWIVRDARLAFLLGETAGRGAAEERVAVLASLGIPAHVLRIPYDDGTEFYRVYAGAYASDAEAAWMGSLLDEREITDAPLTERIGTISG